MRKILRRRGSSHGSYDAADLTSALLPIRNDDFVSNSRVNGSFDVIVGDYITRDKLVISFHRLLISEIVYSKR